MNILKKGILLIFTSILIVSCSSDEDANETIVTVSNLTKNIDENSLQGSIIGMVNGSSNTGTVNFSIVNQIPNGALAINATTGELTIADETVFDFETNPSITASVRVSAGETTNNATVTVNLNDKDDLEFLLSTSKTAYNNASTNTWVEITETEYDNLAEKLNNVSKTGATEADFNNSVTIDHGSSPEYTVANIDASTTIPNTGYLFAFKYVISSKGHGVTATTAQIKQSSTSNHQGFIDIGNTLPSHSISSLIKTYYFVIKGNTTATTGTGYMAFTKSSNTNPAFKRITGTTYHYQSGNSNNLGSTIYNGSGSGVKWLHQGLATTQKQW